MKTLKYFPALIIFISATLLASDLNLSLKGDLRLRGEDSLKEEKENGETTEFPDRPRFRYRLRLSGKAEYGSLVKAVFGLASGSSEIVETGINGTKHEIEDSAVSSNQTFDGFFSSKPLWIDLAYAEITPLKQLSIFAGKMKHPIFMAGDLMWDSDINPEGTAFVTNISLHENIGTFLNGAVFMLDEHKKDDDALLAAIQGGILFSHEKFSAKAAISYYNPTNLHNSGMEMDYNVIAADFELFYLMSSIRAGVIGQFLHNTSVKEEALADEKEKDETTGFLLGVAAGNEKIKEFGDWNAKVMYRMLQKHSWFEDFTDSDSIGTNSAGFEAIVDFGLYKNISLALDYYNIRTLNKDFNKGVEESYQLFQGDIVFKF